MQQNAILQDIPVLTITTEAQQHFRALIAKEFEAGTVNLRITVTDPGTKKADVGITFCYQGDENPGDIAIDYPGFILYIENSAVDALRDAVIHYKTDALTLGGELSVKAPFIKGRAPAKDDPLQLRVQHLIDNEINPNLASHGGFVSLVSANSNGVVVLKFGGGCHGCGMADVTLKSGIEKTLMQHCPDITAVQDVTDHATGENPYYT